MATPEPRSAEAADSVWRSGDFRRLAAGTQVAGELLCDVVPTRAGDRVLDVATGTGSTALSAARRRARVVAIDLLPELLEVVRRRAQFEGLEVATRAGSMEPLAFGAGEFDVVISTFGTMFAQDPDAMAAELLRVVRPGGIVASASWTPSSFFGRLLRLLGAERPALAGLGDVRAWGTPAGFRRLFRAAEAIRFRRAQVWLRSESPEAFAAYLDRFFGPLAAARARRNAAERTALHAATVRLLTPAHPHGDDLLLPVPFLIGVARRPH